MVFRRLVPSEVTSMRLAGQVQRRLTGTRCQWHPHMMRTPWATTSDRSGVDHAAISIGLAQVQVWTATTHYVALDEDDHRSAAPDSKATTDR